MRCSTITQGHWERLCLQGLYPGGHLLLRTRDGRMLSCDLQHSRQLACWKVSRLMGSEQWKMHFQCWALMLGHARVSVHLLQVGQHA